MPAKDSDDVLLVTIFFGLVAAMAAGFPMAFDNSSEEMKVSVGWGLLIVGFMLASYFLYRLRKNHFSETIKKKEDVETEIMNNFLIYMVLSLAAEIIIFFGMGQLIPDKFTALGIGGIAFVTLWLASQRAISVAAKENGIYVLEEWIIYTLKTMWRDNKKIREVFDIYVLPLTAFYVSLIFLSMWPFSLLDRIHLRLDAPQPISAIYFFTLLATLVVTSGFSYLLGIRLIMRSWKAYRGEIIRTPKLRVLIGLCTKPYIVFALSSIVTGIVLYLVSAVLQFMILHALGPGHNWLMLTISLLSLTLPFLISTGVPFFITAKWVVRKWIKIDVVQNNPVISLVHPGRPA